MPSPTENTPLFPRPDLPAPPFQLLPSDQEAQAAFRRYERPPWGKPEPYVLQRYFAPDGKYVVVDTPSTYAQSASDQDRWRVENDQLCIKGPPNAHRWQCYRMARAVDGALQWYVDEPDSPAHQQLTVVTREIVDGPPRR